MPRHTQILYRPRVLAEAAQRHAATTNTLAFALTGIGLPLAPIVWVLTGWYMRRYHETLEVLLTRRDCVVRLGVWHRQEKTIPLEKITDVALLQGPLMRRFGVKKLRIETAGQVSGGFGLVNVVGIEDPEGFRDRILAQRDRISDPDYGTGEASGLPDDVAPGDDASARGPGRLPGGGFGGADPEVVALLREIRDAVRGTTSRRE